MNPRTPRDLRIPTLYGLVIALGISLGYWSVKEPSGVTQIYYARVPSSLPDYDVKYYDLVENQRCRLVKDNVALIRERDPQDKFLVMYWSPQRANEWGSVELEFTWDIDQDPDLAILDPNLHIFGQYDTNAEGEIAVSSAATQRRWVTLATIGKSKFPFAIATPIDITPWIQGSQSLKIRYRIKAARLMYHPTPNDPIGLASAQCLRQNKDWEHASRLRIWKKLPSEP